MQCAKCAVGLAQIQHIKHVELAGALACQKTHSAQAAIGIASAAAGLVRDFHTFACAGKQHGVVANDVTATHGGKTNGVFLALASVAKALVYGAVFQLGALGGQ